MAQALGGSQSAFEQIVRRYQRPIISLIARMTEDRALAEDLAQETFVKAFRSLAAFDTTRRLSSWLFRIAHNTALDALRRSRSAGDLHGRDATPDDRASDDPAAPPEPDPVEREALGRRWRRRWRSFGRTTAPPSCCATRKGLSFDEIGIVLGVPEVTARSHVHRARKELAQLLTASGWAPPSTLRPGLQAGLKAGTQRSAAYGR